MKGIGTKRVRYGLVGAVGFLLAACTIEVPRSPAPDDDEVAPRVPQRDPPNHGNGGSGGGGSHGGGGGTTSTVGGDIGGAGPNTSALPCDHGWVPPSSPTSPSAITPLVTGGGEPFAIVGDDLVFTRGEYSTGYRVCALPLDLSTAPIEILPSLYHVWHRKASGGALAFWWADGAMRVWTRATGLVDVGTVPCLNGTFSASADGSRIAFAEAPSMFRIWNVATGSSVLLDIGGDCQARKFVGNALFAHFCPGPVGALAAAKLVKVDPDGTVVRLDAANDDAAPTLAPRPAWERSEDEYERTTQYYYEPPYSYPFASRSESTLSRRGDWAPSVDSSGSKLFVRRLDRMGAFITTGSTNTTVLIDNDVAEGFMLPDGTAAIYRTTGNVLKKATTTDPPVVTVLAVGATEILDRSPDSKTILFGTLDPQSGSGFVDVSAVDHTAPVPAAVSLVPTATVQRVSLSVNGASTHLVFEQPTDGTGWAYRSIPLTGGNTTTLGTVPGTAPHFAGSDLGFFRLGANKIRTPLYYIDDSWDYEVYARTDYVDVVTGETSSLGIDFTTGIVKGNRQVFATAAGVIWTTIVP